MKCIKCGHELKDGAVYCIRCGTMQVSMEGERLSAKDLADSDKAVGMRPAREFEQAPSGNGKRIAIIVVVLVVVAAIIAILAYSCMEQKRSEDEAANAAASAVFSSDSASSAATSTTSSTSSTSASSTAASSSAASASASAASSAASQSAAAQNQPAVQEQQPQPQPQPQPEPEPQPQVGDQPSYAPEPTSGDYVLGDSSSRYYSRDELESMSASDLYYARNEIFARHGRMFHRSDLQAYFDSKGWYNPIYTPEQWDAMGDQLSDVERQNASLMAEVEASKNSGYL